MRKTTSTNAINEKEILQHCDMTYTLSVIGGRWKPNILWALFRHERVRYSHLKKIIPGISERILALQLRELEENKIIMRHIYAEVPPRVEYELTTLGKTMEPMVSAMASWGNLHRTTNEEK